MNNEHIYTQTDLDKSGFRTAKSCYTHHHSLPSFLPLFKGEGVSDSRRRAFFLFVSLVTHSQSVESRTLHLERWQISPLLSD